MTRWEWWVSTGKVRPAGAKPVASTATPPFPRKAEDKLMS